VLLRYASWLSHSGQRLACMRTAALPAPTGQHHAVRQGPHATAPCAVVCATGATPCVRALVTAHKNCTTHAHTHTRSTHTVLNQPTLGGAKGRLWRAVKCRLAVCIPRHS
jgi:hypothetical protein